MNSDSTSRARVAAIADGMIAARSGTRGSPADSRDLFLAALDVSADLIYVVDTASGKLLEVNQTTCSALGYARDELLTMTIGDIQEGSYAAGFQKRLAHLVGIRPRAFTRKSVFRRKDGTTFPVEINARAVELGGKVVMVSVMRDVSESERIERELSLSEERFFTIFRSSPVAMAIGTATDGRLIDVNDRYLELFGCRREELIGRTTAERGDWVDPEQRMELVRRIESGEKIRNVEARFRRKSGEIGFALFSMEIVRLRGESVLVTMRVDITERKRTEEALRQALEERECLVRDLHDGIVQQIYAVGLRLEQAQRNVVGGAARSAADGLAQAITDLNTLIRTLRGHILGSPPQVLDGHQLRAELQELARSVDGAQRLRFRLEIDQEAALRLTPDSANQVLNIVREAMSNSLRHSCGQHGLVSLQSNRDGLRVVVEDDGHGFDRDRAGSDGQGLRNMAARASQLNAHLKIHSSPGSGTRITLEIPALNGEVVR